jgi:hypothetical protein
METKVLIIILMFVTQSAAAFSWKPTEYHAASTAKELAHCAGLYSHVNKIHLPNMDEFQARIKPYKKDYHGPFELRQYERNDINTAEKYKASSVLHYIKAGLKPEEAVFTTNMLIQGNIRTPTDGQHWDVIVDDKYIEKGLSDCNSDRYKLLVDRDILPFSPFPTEDYNEHLKNYKNYVFDTDTK